jgi:hypothetical protein
VDLRCWLEVLNSGSHGFHEVLGATKARLTLWGYLSFSLITQTMFKRIAYKFSLIQIFFHTRKFDHFEIKSTDSVIKFQTHIKSIVIGLQHMIPPL